MRCLPTFVHATRSGAANDPRIWVNGIKPLQPHYDTWWARTNILIGAGKPLQQILVSHADGLARHERAHLKQIERINKTLQGAP
jgi:hypothetical protein